MNLFLPLVLCLVASISGLQVEGPVTYQLDARPNGPNGACVVGCGPSGSDEGCHGFAELKAKTSPEDTRLFKIDKALEDPEDSKMSKLTLDPPVRPIARNFGKSLNVQGNCCWQFHEGKRYTRDWKIVRNSGEIELNWVPRSLKLIAC